MSFYIHHFILTRFNLLLWNKDKEGKKVRSASWLEHRFELFERCCLPSIVAQTYQEFEWIVLFDSTTPEIYKEKIADYQKRCPQLIPVYVEPFSRHNPVAVAVLYGTNPVAVTTFWT